MIRSRTWLIIVVLLAACGGSATPAPGVPGGSSVATPGDAASAPAAEAPATAGQPGGATIVDACTLLSVDEIAAALGEAVGPGEFAGMEGAPGCAWNAVDADSEASVGLLMTTSEGYGRDRYGQNTTDLSIAGADEAFAIESGSDGAAINVRVGDLRILMDADTRSDDTPADDEFVAALVRLAEMIVPKVRQ